MEKLVIGMDNALLQEGGLKSESTGFVIIKIKNEWLVILNGMKFVSLLVVLSKIFPVYKSFRGCCVYFLTCGILKKKVITMVNGDSCTKEVGQLSRWMKKKWNWLQ